MEQWAMDWVGDIADLYRLNQKRLDVQPETAKRDEAQAGLEKAVEEMARKRDAQIEQQPPLHPAAQKVLESMRRHWDGLTLFVDNPEIPMDNNLAERMLRGPVSGRKAFYGSGAQWSGELAVMMFTIFQTLKLWDINPKTWLQSFFRACAENGAKVPADLSVFLPWEMDEERKKALELPPPTCYDTS
jgi:transposase